MNLRFGVYIFALIAFMKCGINVIWMYSIDLKNQIKLLWKSCQKFDKLKYFTYNRVYSMKFYSLNLIKMGNLEQTTESTDLNQQVENVLENMDQTDRENTTFGYTQDAIKQTTNNFTENTIVENTPTGKKFWWIDLNLNSNYEVPWISIKALNNKNKKDFPNVRFGDCRLSRWLWSVTYSDSLVVPNNWGEKRETHKETFYSQKVLPWWALNIPWRHVANDGTVRDKDWYICVAAPLQIYPKGTRIMTTLWPGKVYDTWKMTWKWIDIYTNW